MAADEIAKANVPATETRIHARRSYIVSSISKLAVLKDYGFHVITCADYFCEFIAWACFVLVC
jgi:hypothetical protein